MYRAYAIENELNQAERHRLDTDVKHWTFVRKHFTTFAAHCRGRSIANNLTSAGGVLIVYLLRLFPTGFDGTSAILWPTILTGSDAPIVIRAKPSDDKAFIKAVRFFARSTAMPPWWTWSAMCSTHLSCRLLGFCC